MIQNADERTPRCHGTPSNATEPDLWAVAPRSRMNNQLRGKPSNNASPPKDTYAARQPAWLMTDWAMTGKIIAPSPAPTITKASAVPSRL